MLVAQCILKQWFVGSSSTRVHAKITAWLSLGYDFVWGLE